MKEKQVEIHAFDNTPVSNAWLKDKLQGSPTSSDEQQELELLRNKFIVHPYLLGASDGNVTLRLPRGFVASFAGEVSGSRRGFGDTSKKWIASARTLPTIL
ncbi:MAG: hypothetical protein SGPRY_010881, partial [Prymnesium sp.]